MAAEVTEYLAAQRAFDMAVERWQAGRSYALLPWPYQVMLLAREVAVRPVRRWEREHDDGIQRSADRPDRESSGRPRAKLPRAS